MDTAEIKISVVTPSLNQGQFIEEMIQSVLKQNNEYYEHIIIDACSTDNTLEILKKYPHLTWISEPDKGQSDALNKGFKKATGDWVLWLNADDILLPKAIHKLVGIIRKKPNADVLYGHMLFFNDLSGKIVKHQYFNNFSKSDITLGILVPPTTGTLFRKSILLNNPLDLSFHYMMDAEWFFRCRHKIKVVRIDDFLIKFRISEVNKTSAQLLKGKLSAQHIKENDLYRIRCREAYPALNKTFYKLLKMLMRYRNRIVKLKYYLRKKPLINS